MELNDYNAVLQQLVSIPGLQEQLQKQFGLSAAMSVINRNSRPPTDPLSEFNLSKGMTTAAALMTDDEIQALPYQTGSAPGQTWPGDPNWKGQPKANPAREAMILNYLRQQPGFQVPKFQLPKAPMLQ